MFTTRNYHKPTSVLVGLLMGAGLVPAAEEDLVRSRMEPSLARQRESVRRQVSQAVPGDPSWFTVPWPAQPTVAETARACGPLDEAKREALIRDAASRTKLPPDLIREVARRESGFDPCAVSVKGAQGIMQLMPATASAFGVTDPFDATQNVDGGARLLRSLMDQYAGDLRLVLSAYNAGPEAVQRHSGVPPFAETKDYVAAILARLSAPTD